MFQPTSHSFLPPYFSFLSSMLCMYMESRIISFTLLLNLNKESFDFKCRFCLVFSFSYFLAFGNQNPSFCVETDSTLFCNVKLHKPSKPCIAYWIAQFSLFILHNLVINYCPQYHTSESGKLLLMFRNIDFHAYLQNTHYDFSISCVNTVLFHLLLKMCGKLCFSFDSG